ncbi:MAG TPA: hypothetical protein VD978_28305 [Azospirillum sp.]|nr:hypothetical protein [Azospirillum sp.]
MLRELWEYLTTPASRTARRLGYVAKAVALGARHRRQRRAWTPHVEAARRFVLDAAAQAAPGRALIAGSGRLIEVPLAELAARFDAVVLADLVHPRAVRRQARRFGNVTLAEIDLTGALDRMEDRGADGVLSPAPPDPIPPDLGRFDFAVSCNLLSQLPLLPLEALERRGVGEAPRAAFARALVTAHLEWLRGCADVAALFTDTERHWLEHGRPVAHNESLWGVPLPPPDLTWAWDIAPRGEEDRRLDLRLTVAAWRNLNA